MGKDFDMKTSKIRTSLLILAAALSLTTSPTFAQPFGNLPVNATYWIPISFSIEVDNTRLKFSVSKTRSSVLGQGFALSHDVVAHTTQDKCEATIVSQVCNSGNCQIEKSELDPSIQRIFRRPEQNLVTFSYCAPYEIYLEEETPVLFANRGGN
jgi:hypothetical protein